MVFYYVPCLALVCTFFFFVMLLILKFYSVLISPFVSIRSVFLAICFLVCCVEKHVKEKAQREPIYGKMLHMEPIHRKMPQREPMYRRRSQRDPKIKIAHDLIDKSDMWFCSDKFMICSDMYVCYVICWELCLLCFDIFSEIKIIFKIKLYLWYDIRVFDWPPLAKEQVDNKEQ